MELEGRPSKKEAVVAPAVEPIVSLLVVAGVAPVAVAVAAASDEVASGTEEPAGGETATPPPRQW